MRHSEASYFSVLFTVVFLYTGTSAPTLTTTLVNIVYVAELAVRHVIAILAIANVNCLQRWALSLAPSS